MTWTITHEPSGDEAEALTQSAAHVAARTLLADNGEQGTCRIWRNGAVRAVVFPDWLNESAATPYAYDIGDPKHPRYHSTHADIWDNREKC